MFQLYHSLQGTVNAYIQSTAASIIYAKVPSAIHSVPVVFVAVKVLFASTWIFSADFDEVKNELN